MKISKRYKENFNKIDSDQDYLLDDAGELLAVAKLSKPLLKSYSREAIIKVKLDF